MPGKYGVERGYWGRWLASEDQLGVIELSSFYRRSVSMLARTNGMRCAMDAGVMRAKVEWVEFNTMSNQKCGHKCRVEIKII